MNQDIVTLQSRKNQKKQNKKSHHDPHTHTKPTRPLLISPPSPKHIHHHDPPSALLLPLYYPFRLRRMSRSEGGRTGGRQHLTNL